MRTKICFFAVSCLALAVSCNDPAQSDSPIAKTIDVTIGSGPRFDISAESRTQLGDDGVSVTWKTTDKIALWAKNSQSALQLTAQPFSLWHYNQTFNSASFTASVAEMPTDTYIYYAVSPVPSSVAGTTASYTIPSTQDGTFHGEYDIMVATPVTAGALQQGDNTQSINFNFTHKIHLLKIRIPSNNLGEDISAIRLDFPTAVTGSLSVDATNPTAAPIVTNGSNTLTLEFATPKKVGDVVYAMIAPVALTAEQNFTITAIGDTCETNPMEISGKNFASGHTTPLAYNIPTAGIYYTRLTFALPSDKGTATLGETVTNITLTAPAGSTFDNGSNVRTFSPNSNGQYTIILRPKAWPADNLSNKSIAVNYESDNAIVANKITLPQLAINAQNNISLSVPYLLAEDFSTVQTYSDHEDTSGVSDPDAIWIPGLSGWSAARTGGSAGKSVRIVGHREGGMWVPADYEARMDSAPMAAIKSGKSVTVKISFNYSGGTNKGTPKFKYGTSTATGLQNGANSSIEKQIGSVGANTSGSYTSVNQSITPFTTSATNATRIAWVAYGDDSIPFKLSYYYYYIYIDNIKVSISK